VCTGKRGTYLRGPKPDPLGANIDPLELAGLWKVLLHVGTAVVEPTDGHTYDPTDGATTDPYPEVPACASAAVLERANVVANTIVVSFMVLTFLTDQIGDNRIVCSTVPLKFSLSVMEAAS
jgi:hypothetical protein